MSNACSARQKVAIKSVGCRTNQEEMVTLRFQLEDEGYEVTDIIEHADIIIVNTCAVTSVTESKTRRLMNIIASCAPDAQILVTGCLAQQKPAELKEFQNVKWVVGNTYKENIVSILKDAQGVFHSSFDPISDSPLQLSNLYLHSPANDNAFGKTRFPVKIQEGCNFRCSYCIVPSLRGPSRSADMDTVIGVCKKAVEAGYKEIVLTGTHIGQYGKENHLSVEFLLEHLLAIEGDFRIRLSSLDPRDLNGDLLEMIGNNEKICDHLHVSLQSLSDEVLEKMNRPYEDIEGVINRLIDFRSKYPFAGLGADLIVGHPGESDQNFYETLDNVRKIGFSYAHIFRYSVRPGTAAAVLPEQQPETVKTKRSELLRNVVEESKTAFLKKMHGIKGKIIVESEHPVRGLTSNYLHVEIPEFTAEYNTWLDVVILGNNQGRFCLAEPITCEVV